MTILPGGLICGGCHEDSTNRAKVAELLRPHPSSAGHEQLSLPEHAYRLKEGQDDICPIPGDSAAAVSPPLLGGQRRRGLEVSYLADPLPGTLCSC